MTARRDIVPRFIRGVAATLESYPPFGFVVDSATVRVGTNSTAMPTSGSAATVDSTFTTTSAAATQGDTTITVAGLSASTHFLRALLGRGVGSVGDDALDVEIAPHGTITNGSVTLSEPLPCDIPSGSTLIGHRLTTSLSAGDTATIGEGVAEWTALDADGNEHKWATHFRVVERDVQYTLTATTLTSSSGYVTKNRPDNDADFTETIDAAWRRYVLPKLLAKALRPERIVSGEHFEAVHIAACEYYCAMEAPDPSPENRAERKALLADAMETVLQASDLWLTPVTEDLSNTTSTDGVPGLGAGAAYSVCFLER